MDESTRPFSPSVGASVIPLSSRRSLVAAGMATLLAAAVCGPALTQSESQDDLVWRRLAVSGLTGTALADVAADGTAAAVIAADHRKQGDRATVWYSSDGRSGWSPVDRPPAAVGDVLALEHGTDGWLFIGPSPAWASSDGIDWRDAAGSPAPADAPSIEVGEHRLMLGPDGWASAPSDTGEWMPVPELQAIDLVIPLASGGIAIGDGIVATSADGATWTRSPEPLLGSAELRAASVLDDGSVLVVGQAPAYGDRKIPALWIAETSAARQVASLDDSAARYTELADAYNAERARVLKKPLRTLQQARKAARGLADNAATLAEDMAAWPWPGDASAKAAELVAFLDAMGGGWTRMSGAKNSKAFSQANKRTLQLDPWNVASAYEIREALGLPISKELKRAYRRLGER